MEELVYELGVPAVVGTTSGTIFSCMDIAQKEHVVQISPTAGTTKLDSIGGEWVFRTTSSDKVMGLGMAVEAILLGKKCPLQHPTTGQSGLLQRETSDKNQYDSILF